MSRMAGRDDDYARAIMAAADGDDGRGRASRMPPTIGRPKPLSIEPARPSAAKFGAGGSAVRGDNPRSANAGGDGYARREETRPPATSQSHGNEPARDRLDPPPAPAPVALKRRQLNIHLTGALYGRLQQVAAAEGLPPSTKGRELLELALTEGMPPTRPEPLVELTGKPMVRAAVLAAANEAGAELHAFCAKLIDLGLECWLEGGGE